MPVGVALTWRLAAVPVPEDSTVSAALSLICTVPEDDSVPPESVLELENVASVALATGFSLSRQRFPSDKTERIRRVLVPRGGQTLPVKPDWAILVDLLRHRGSPLTVDVTCSSTGESVNARGAHAPSVNDLTAFDFDPGVPFLAGLQDSDAPVGVAIEVSVSSRSTVDPGLLQTIGQTVLGVPVTALTPRQAAGSARSVYSPEVALRAWHGPYARLQGRGIFSAPPSIPSSRDLSKRTGVTLGTTTVQGPDWDRPSALRLSEEERLRHLYIVGKTGAGKTNLMKLLAEQDIRAGYGVAVITPHGDLIDYLLATVDERADDVTLLDFGDPENVPVVNPLTLDTDTSTEYSTTVSRLVDLISHRTFNQYTGPVFADSVRLALDTVRELIPDTGKYATISAGIEIVKSDKLQRWACRSVQDKRPDLAEEWERVFNMRGSEASETSRWVTAKFSDMGAHSALRAITTQVGPTPLSMREIYRKNKILFVRLPDTHMPSSAASLLGALLFNRLFQEAKLAGAGDRRPFYLHVDEFQRFVSSDLEELVAEARKFRLGLTIAHQNLRQLEAFSTFEGSSTPRLADAIFSNVGTLIAMKTAGRDVPRFAEELSLPEAEVRAISRGNAIVRTGHDGDDITCSISIPLADAPVRQSAAKSVARRMLRERIWRPRQDQDAQAERLLAGLREQALTRPPGTRAPFGQPVKTAGGGGGTATGKDGSSSSFLDEWLAKRRDRAEETSTGTIDESTSGAPTRLSTATPASEPADESA